MPECWPQACYMCKPDECLGALEMERRHRWETWAGLYHQRAFS